MSNKEADLETILRLAKAEREIRSQLADLVPQVVANGATWAEVGAAAGITKQVAHKRWSNKGRTSNADYQRRMRYDARGQLQLGTAGRSTKGDRRPRHP